MSMHSTLAAALGQLETLEKSSREEGGPHLVGQVEALRQAVLAVARERAVLEERLAKVSTARLGLRTALGEVTRRYEESLRTFERVRQGAAMVRRLRTLDDLPDLLDRLRAFFRVGLVRLVLDRERFADLAPERCQFASQEDLLAMATSEDGGKVYLGAVSQAPAGLFSQEERARFQSCFVYPLEDRFRPGYLVALALAADVRPGRYSPEMATDFLEHFFDSLGHEVSELADRLQAERLREDVERITRHDLKSPLSAILSLPQLLLEDQGLDEGQREMVRMILAAGRRMQDMITLSLSLYRMEKGVYALAPERIDGVSLARTVWSDVGPAYVRNGYRLEIDATELPFAMLGEELLLYTMLANLVKNALEASPLGGTVRVLFGREAGWSLIAVCNQGEAPEAVRDHFFEKYASHGKAGGTGLGAYSARLIAQTHGGGVALHTGNGRTCVKVRLPDEPV
ncbi:hypothetical protein JCM15519_25350 [Fundidesulfovibrio butyratiphilus]